MNPILLKPQSDIGAQLIVRGQRVGVLQASAHGRSKQDLLQIALDSYRALTQQADLMIVEGAGSPAETNLRTHDIANMGFAHAADVPVVLVGDIDRGHVIASLVGTHTVLDADDRARIKGFIINKFRGDATLFDAGLQTIAQRTGWPSLGMVPWLRAASRLPEEDAVPLDRSRASQASERRIKVAIAQFPHIANFDDFDPLRMEAALDVQFVPPGRPLPRDAALIILPGSKATIADLEFMRVQGWDLDVRVHVRHGGRVLGICAGYQMLGRIVRDPQRIEGLQDASEGLGLLDIETTMTSHKVLREVAGTESLTSARIRGYEMHLGETTGPATAHPMIRFDDGTNDGAITGDGRIAGCHVHGLFTATAFRTAFIASLGARSCGEDYDAVVDTALDEVANALEAALDIEALGGIAGL